MNTFNEADHPRDTGRFTDKQQSAPEANIARPVLTPEHLAEAAYAAAHRVDVSELEPADVKAAHNLMLPLIRAQETLKRPARDAEWFADRAIRENAKVHDGLPMPGRIHARRVATAAARAAQTAALATRAASRTPDQIAEDVVSSYLAPGNDESLDRSELLIIAGNAARAAQTAPSFKVGMEPDAYRDQWEKIEKAGDGSLADTFRVKMTSEDADGSWLPITPDQSRRILQMLSSEAKE